MDTTPNIITIYFYCSLITIGYNDKLNAILIFFLQFTKSIAKKTLLFLQLRTIQGSNMRM